MVAAGGIEGSFLVAAVSGEQQEPGCLVPRSGIDQPILGDAGGGVLAALDDPIPAHAVVGDDLDHEVGGPFDPCPLSARGMPFGDEEDVRFARSTAIEKAHRQWGNEHLADLRQRVLVSGRLTRTLDGQPLTLTDVQTIRRLGSGLLPRPADLLGIEPDITGQMPSEDWVDWRRRG